jgi:hypothetical protein
MTAISLKRLFARKVSIRLCSLAAGTLAALKKALQRVFSWARWAELLDFNQNKRSVFFKPSTAPAVSAQRQKAMPH